MIAAFLSAPLAAQDIAFDTMPILSCLEAEDTPTDCIGRAARTCMGATPGGDSTVGMGACLWAEAEFWDDRLNAAYRTLRARHLDADAEAALLDITVPSLAETLQQMQRAWIDYRDAACAYERANWGGGTGQGPAGAACVMSLTGEQALKLEDRLGEDLR
nr:lysozyme inhibitor LprI family protein [Jannaschia sp. S6380]